MITVRGNFSRGEATGCVEVGIQTNEGGEYRYTNCKGTSSGWAALKPGDSAKICMIPGSLEILGDISATLVGPCTQ